jgi:sulfur carrier protein ThiS
VTRIGPKIRLVTHGGLPCSERASSPDDTIVVDPGATLAEVLQSIGIDRGLVGVAAMDGRFIQLDAVLKTDGVIHVYPIFGGG